VVEHTRPKSVVRAPCRPAFWSKRTADEAAAAENLQRLGEALLAREQAHAEAFARCLHEGVGGRLVERAVDDPELRERRGNHEWLRGLCLPVGEVRGADKGRRRVRGVTGMQRQQVGGGGDDPPEAIGAEIRCRQREEAGFEEAPAAFASEAAVPFCAALGEGVMKVAEHEPAPPRQQEENRIAGRGGEDAQHGFGQVRRQPAEELEQEEQHGVLVMAVAARVRQPNSARRAGCPIGGGALRAGDLAFDLAPPSGWTRFFPSPDRPGAPPSP
jgi:hypothetical protein